jgi:carbon-monoxide dehydrogenase small subunit
MILAAKAMLDENPRPSTDEIKHYMRGNICRCTGYKKILEAIVAASEAMSGKASGASR